MPLPCGCRDGNQHGTVPVALNRTDAAGGDGEELDEKGGLFPVLETVDRVGDFLALDGDLVIPSDRAIIIEVQAQAAVQAEEALKAVIQWEKCLAEVMEEGEDKDTVPHTRLVLATGFEPVHESGQMAVLIQSHADGQPMVEVGLADDIPAATGKVPLVIGVCFEQEIELAVILETDNVLALQTAGDLAQDAFLLLEYFGRNRKVYCATKTAFSILMAIGSVTNIGKYPPTIHFIQA